jgi:large conductance mechanosensitive channel
MSDFLTFIREQGVMGLAIGFILGGAVSGLIKALIDDLINPLLGLVLGSVAGLKTASFGILGAQILWGDFVAVAINFIVIALVVYYGFKILKLDTLDKKKA